MAEKENGAEENVPPPTETDFEPESDLIDRYERMVQTQVETLNGIDTTDRPRNALVRR